MEPRLGQSLLQLQWQTDRNSTNLEHFSLEMPKMYRIIAPLYRHCTDAVPKCAESVPKAYRRSRAQTRMSDLNDFIVEANLDTALATRLRAYFRHMQARARS